jgi:TonB-dependent receptor
MSRRAGKQRSKSIQRTSAAALLAFAIDPTIHAQTQSDSESKPESLEDVVVKGIRESLKSSQAIKREANVFVDSVTAEDIGALPDRSVTEALQRIPGVAINRFAAGGDPDHFTAEGAGVVVRGLTYVRSELNGRDTFTANNGRELSFADVPPELMGGVDVFKNQSADMVEGGLAGTVNLRTRRPFDSKDQVFAGSAEANYGDFSEKWSPTVSALYSNRWDTGLGELGVLVNGVYSELKTRSDGAQASNFRLRNDFVGQDMPDGAEVWAPRGAAFRSQDTERTRKGYAAALQWASPDDTKLATFQFLRSDATTAWTEHAVETATDLVGDTFRPVAGTQFEFDSSGVFTRGIITDANSGWRSDQTEETAADQRNRTSTDGMQHNAIRRDVDQQYVTSDYGLNFKWELNDRWGLSVDAQHVDSTVESLDFGVWASVYANVALDLTGSLPSIQLLPPSLSGAGAQDAASYFSDPANYFWRSAMDHIEASDGDENSLRLDLERSFADSDWLESIQFGARGARRDQTTRWTAYNWGRISEIWGNSGPVWFNEPVDGVPSSLAEGPSPSGAPSFNQAAFFNYPNFMKGDASVPALVPFWGSNVAENYQAVSDYIRTVNAEWEGDASTGGWRPLAQRTVGDLIPGTPFRPNEINHVVEDAGAFYVQLNYNHDLSNGMRFGGNLGVRYVETDYSSDGSLIFPTGNAYEEAPCLVPLEPGASPIPFCSLSPEDRQRVRNYANGASVPLTTKHKYRNVLPSFNLKFALANDKIVRFAFSKAMRRPEMGLLRNYLTQTQLDVPDPDRPGRTLFAGFQGESGDPQLNPMRSNQFDLSYEWYFAPVGSVTVSTFYKELRDVITNGFRDEDLVNNGETFTVQVRGPVNSDEVGKVKGIELAYQQFYNMLPAPFSGFGIQTNYTYIDSSNVPQINLSTNDPNGPGVSEPTINTGLLPLENLSKHNANFAALYEKGPVSARLAYSWRSDFLLTTRDVIVPNAPIMNEATGQLDGSFFYTFNGGFKVGIQGVNLLNEVTKTSQILNDNLLSTGRSWFMNDRRISVVMRASF